MRKVWVLATASVLLGIAGCNDSKSPLDAGTQTVSIAFNARGQVLVYNIWDTPSTPGIPFYCQQQFDGLTPRVREAQVGWPLAVEISQILPGTTTEQVVATSIGGANEFSSVTPYDERILANPLDTTDPFGFPAVNGRQVTTANRDYLVHCAGFATVELPDANILGAPGTFDIPVQQGTTIIVRAREIEYINAFAFSGATVASPALSGFAFLDDVEVTPSGTSFVSDQDGGGFTFSVRVR